MNKKFDFDYVISGCGMTSLLKHEPDAPYFNELKNTFNDLRALAKDEANKHSNYMNHSLSKLYNAFQEVSFIQKFKELDNVGADGIYADSGGLQIVTRGITIDDTVRKQIYENQVYADYAMCFDVISLKNLSTTYTKNERMLIDNKIFVNENHKEAGIATGQNIKEQIQYFRSKNAKTKVILIVQGNCCEDMLLFYEAIASQLSEEDYEYVGGLAVADTCMGNGELESIEMIFAAQKIAKICHPAVKKSLHILGMGAINRMRPVVYLVKSGYLNAFDRISYDSSSISITCLMGNLNFAGKLGKLGPYKTLEGEVHFRKMFEFFKPILSKYGTEDQFVDYVYGDGEKGCWTYAKIRDRVQDKDNKILGLVAHPCHVYYQISYFMRHIDRLFEDVYLRSDPINQLLNVKNEEDEKYWITNFSKYLRSNRIMSNNFSNLEGFFE